MAWHLSLGIDEGILHKTDAKDITRQRFIFSMLVIMLLVVSLLIFVSSVTYLLIIFQNWLVAIGAGLILSIIIFNLYRFILVTAINAENTFLGTYQLNHELQYNDFFVNGKIDEIAIMPDEQIMKIVNVRKDQLRDSSTIINKKNYKFSQSFFTNFTRVLFLAIIAMVFSTGFQLLIFKGQINEVLEKTSQILSQELPDSCLLMNVLTPPNGEEFVLLNCNSLLLVIHLLVKGLGFWKLVMDLVFMLLILLPLILIHKSKEIQNGSYVKELALHEVSISFFHFLKTQKFCADLLKQNLSDDLMKRIKK
jgi:hypothetical protein